MSRDSDTDRRTVLRTLAAGAAAVGSTGVASAAGGPTVTAPSTERAATAVETHADGVLRQLVADGVIDDRSAIPTAPAHAADLAGGADGVTAFELEDGTEELRAETTVDAGRLALGVRPDDGHAYAILDTGDGKVRYDETGSEDVSTQSYTCRCTNLTCGNGYALAECRDDTTGELVDTRCNC